MRIVISLLAIAIALCLSVPAAAAPTITCRPIGDTTYTLKGDDFGDAAELAVTINYDTANVSLPHLDAGGATLSPPDAVTSSPLGRLSFRVLFGKKPAALDMILLLEKTDHTPAIINFITAELIDANGLPTPVSVQISPPPEPLPAPPATADEPAPPQSSP